MTPEELKALAEKITSGSATPEERLLFVKEMNAAIKELREDLARVKTSKQ